MFNSKLSRFVISPLGGASLLCPLILYMILLIIYHCANSRITQAKVDFICDVCGMIGLKCVLVCYNLIFFLTLNGCGESGLP